jgi:hypothetical protein
MKVVIWGVLFGFEAAAPTLEDKGFFLALLEQGTGGLGEAEGVVHGLAAEEGVAARKGAQGFDLVFGGEFLPDAGAADVVVALLGGEDSRDEDGHGGGGVEGLKVKSRRSKRMNE